MNEGVRQRCFAATVLSPTSAIINAFDKSKLHTPNSTQKVDKV
jgi:hypothetical protein